VVQTAQVLDLRPVTLEQVDHPIILAEGKIRANSSVGAHRESQILPAARSPDEDRFQVGVWGQEKKRK